MSRPPLSPARRCAYDALIEWEDTSRYAADILDELARRRHISPSDRGLAQDLLYGVIRHLYLLDELIEVLRKGSIKPHTRQLLRIGLYQLFRTQIAEHAAIHETVELARPHERSLINAILRTAQRQKLDLNAQIDTWPAEDRLSHPEFLIRRWTDQYGSEAAESLCTWNNQPAPVYARLNVLARDGEALDRVRSTIEPSLLGGEFPNFFRMSGSLESDWIRQGLIYVQDPSTTLACHLLNPQPGETVLDACAAPGGKTSLLAALMQNQGQIFATDSSESRLQKLRQNLQCLGIDTIESRCIDWMQPAAARDLPLFDAILLDSPCSNTGVMRRRIDVRWRLMERDFDFFARQQLALLRGIASALKPGGRIIYSTCSVDHTENEDVIAASGYNVEKISTSLPWRDGYDGAFAAVLRP